MMKFLHLLKTWYLSQFPAKVTKAEKMGAIIGFVLFTIFMFTFVYPNFAHAAEAAPITTEDLAAAANSANDPFLSAISINERLFGSISLNPIALIGSPNTVIGEVVIVINTVLMAMAAVWLTWSLLKGSVMTAHDGEFIGKGMHSAWVPIRLTIGMASLIPFFKGLCFAQILMLWAIQLSIGGGNMAWQAAVKYIYAGNQVVNPNGMRSSQDLTNSVFNSLLCVKSINYGFALTGDAPQYAHGRAGEKWVFGSTSANSTKEECGSFQFPAKGTTALSAQNYNMRVAAFAKVVTTLEPEAERIAKGFYQAAEDPINFVNPKVDALFFSKVSAMNHEDLRIGTASLFKLANENTRQGELQQGAENAAKSQGFATAGTWFFSLAAKNREASDAISQEITQAKTAELPTADVFVGAHEIYVKSFVLAQSQIEKDGASVQNESWAWQKIKSGICGDTGKSASGVQLTLGQCIVKSTINTGESNQTAIIRISELGNSIVASAAGGITAIGATEGALNGAGKSIVGVGKDLIGAGVVTGIITGAAEAWLEILKQALKALTIFGLIAATYIPLIPAITWVLRVVSIAAQWVEAVVSASVWAFTHLDTDGEGMGGRSGHGYLFLFSVLLNPMLSVLGLILGIALLDIMSVFVLQIYPDMIANAAGENWTGLLMIICYLIIFVIINLTLVNVCMQLINVVPDNIIDWIGGRISSSLAKGSEDVVSGVAKTSLASGGWVPKGVTPKSAKPDLPKVAE